MARRKTRTRKSRPVGPILSEIELSQLGDGVIGYIREMSVREAKRSFPTVKGLPKKGALFALYGADGTPLALTDTHGAALGHAIEENLEVVPLH